MLISYFVPYGLAAVLLLGAVYAAYKPISEAISASAEAERRERQEQLAQGVAESPPQLQPRTDEPPVSTQPSVQELSARDVFLNVLGLAWLLAGITVAVRVPRLTSRWVWWLIAGLALC
jgi:hypothetical protein